MPEAMVTVGPYKDIVLFLVTAGVVAPLFRRARLSPILGFLFAGVSLGPHGLGRLTGEAPWLSYLTVSSPAQFQALGELGVVFLLFMVGLELSWDRLRLMRRMVFGLGAAQVAGSLAAIALAAVALGTPWPAALTLGAALALSSTSLVLPVLAESSRLHAPAGRAAFSVLLFQDLSVAPILIALGLVAAGRAPGGPMGLVLSLGPSLIGVAALIVGGRLALRPLMRSVARVKNDDLFIAACLLVIIGAGLLARMSGLSMALGAFVAGLLLAETEFRHQTEVLIEPFKGLLLGVFFVSLGIGLDVDRLVADPLPVLGLAAAVTALKAVVVFALARPFGLASGPALETALALAAAGEFAFVILGAAAGAGVIPAPLGETVLLASGLTMIAAPGLVSIGRRLGGRLEPPSPAPQTDEEIPAAGEAQALVAGYGRVGQLVGEMLDRHGVRWLAVEGAARQVEAARRSGRPVVFGDASRSDLLRRCGLETAKALIVTMDSPEAVEAVTAAARSLRSDLVIVARARDARHAQRLYDLGASDAVPETIEASLQLSEAALVDLGIPMGLVIASIHERRDEFRAELNRPDALGGRRRRFRDRG